MRFFSPFLLILVLFFSACGSSSSLDKASSLPHHVEFSTPEYKIAVPSNWEKVDPYSDRYQKGMVMAFLEDDQSGKFRANLFLRKENAGEFSTSLDFLQEKMMNNKKSLINYKLMGEEDVLFQTGFGETGSKIFRFQGRNANEAMTLEFMQTVLVENDSAWILTASYDPNKDDQMPETMATIFKNFTLR